MKRLVSIIVFVALTFLSRNASAAVFTIDADLNSVSPIYYQNIVPPYPTIPVNTDLFLNPGDLLEISASGIWSNAPPSYNLIFGPDGNPNENILPGYPGAGYPVAALLGRIGNSNYFFVGNSYSNYVSENGLFYLGFNDTDYGNNWGTVNADVKVSPIPEPSSLLLLGLGLLGARLFRRKACAR